MNLTDKILKKYMGTTGFSESKKVRKVAKKVAPKFNSERLAKAEAFIAADKYRASYEALFIRAKVQPVLAKAESAMIAAKEAGDETKFQRAKNVVKDVAGKVAQAGKDVWRIVKELIKKLIIVIKESFNKIFGLPAQIRKTRKAVEKALAFYKKQEGGSYEVAITTSPFNTQMAAALSKAKKEFKDEVGKAKDAATTIFDSVLADEATIEEFVNQLNADQKAAGLDVTFNAEDLKAIKGLILKVFPDNLEMSGDAVVKFANSTVNYILETFKFANTLKLKNGLNDAEGAVIKKQVEGQIKFMTQLKTATDPLIKAIESIKTNEGAVQNVVVTKDKLVNILGKYAVLLLVLEVIVSLYFRLATMVEYASLGIEKHLAQTDEKLGTSEVFNTPETAQAVRESIGVTSQLINKLRSVLSPLVKRELGYVATTLKSIKPVEDKTKTEDVAK